MSHRPRGTWFDDTLEVIRQDPLIDTSGSMSGIARAPSERAPDAMFVGLGLCSRHRLSKALPVDVLGMLIPAELMRRAAGASELFVLIADRHAKISGFDEEAVERHAQQMEQVLERLHHRFPRMQVVRASSFHDLASYRSVVDEVRAELGPEFHPYVIHQVADMAFLSGEFRHVWKIGWTLGQTQEQALDERYFDELFVRAYGDRLGFAYCKPGRTLSNDRPRVAPYLAGDLNARLCLSPNERIGEKLARAERRKQGEALSGVRNHLRSILYSYRKHVGPVPRGGLEERLESMLRDSLNLAA